MNDYEKNANESKEITNDTSEIISKDFEQFKNIFSSLSNLGETAIYEAVQNKIIDIAYELAGYQIDKMPEKYETTVGERGVRLSGGERQRLGIARALYRNPQVLILDEATSALDNLTEQLVMKEIQKIGNNKTIIMIAHRLSTVKKCDIIFYIEKGELKAQGTYEELIKSSEGFKKIENK